MGSTNPSVLREAILGQAASYSENDPAAAHDDFLSRDRLREEGGATTARPPALTPISRSSAGHAGHMKLLFENAPVAMAMFDTEMRYLLANRRWLEDFKLAGIDVAGRSQYELFPSLHPGWRHVYERALGGQIVRSDRDAVTQDGRPVVYRWEVRPWRHVDSVIGGVMISCERLYTLQGSPGPRSADALPARESDGLWQSALPLLAMKADGSIVRSSKGMASLLRAGSAGDGALSFWQAFAPPEHQEVLRRHVLASLKSVLVDGRAYTVIFSDAANDPETTPSQWIVSRLDEGAQETGRDLALVIGLPGLAPFVPNGPGSSAHGVELSELTEQIGRMQAAVKESADATNLARQRESRLRAVLELAPCGFIVLDDHARPIYHNAHVGLILGRELRQGVGIEEWLAEGARDEAHRAEIARCWTESVWRKHLTMPLALAAADGQLKEIEMRPVSLPGGGLLVMMQDVTESRRSEEMLRATEAKYRTLVHESPVPIVLADRSAAVFDVNPAAESLLGHSRSELRRMSIDSWMDADSIALRSAKLREMQERGERSSTIAVRLIRRGGESSPGELRLCMITDSAGQLLFSVHFFSPLSKDHSTPVVDAGPAAVAPRRQTQSHTQSLLLLTTDMHGRIQEWSDDATERFGYEQAEIVGRGLHTLFRPSDATGFYAEMLAVGSNSTEEPRTVEWPFFHKSEGRQTGPFVLRPRGESALAISLLEEITVFSAAEASEDVSPGGRTDGPTSEEQASGAAITGTVPPSEASVKPARPTPEELSRERLLLGEAHHRVKNHLQIITSMLNLQMSTLHNDEARDALRSSQNRVRSIASLHQHLYQLTTGAHANFKTFAAALISHLRECYEVPEDRVALELGVPDNPVPEEWLLPLSLSLNEMVSNSFKHAFPNGRKGSMCVTLSWEDGKGELTVMDDGAGLPSGFTHHDSSGLGLKILRVFAGQIGGELKMDSADGAGAVFQLVFPVNGAATPAQEETKEKAEEAPKE